jgi:hypothetical protein
MAAELVRETALPDPRLASDQKQPTLPAKGSLKRNVDLAQLRLPADEVFRRNVRDSDLCRRGPTAFGVDRGIYVRQNAFARAYSRVERGILGEYRRVQILEGPARLVPSSSTRVARLSR